MVVLCMSTCLQALRLKEAGEGWIPRAAVEIDTSGARVGPVLRRSVSENHKELAADPGSPTMEAGDR